MSKSLKVFVVVLVALIGAVIVFYYAGGYLSQKSLSESRDTARQAVAVSARKQMDIGLSIYYLDNGRLPSNLDEYLATNNSFANLSVDTLISYRLIDGKHAEICYLIEVDAYQGPECITHTEK